MAVGNLRAFLHKLLQLFFPAAFEGFFLAMPCSGATWRADFPLTNQCSTAERLKTWSYRLYFRVWLWFMGVIPSSHTHPAPVHQIGATPVAEIGVEHP